MMISCLVLNLLTKLKTLQHLSFWLQEWKQYYPSSRVFYLFHPFLASYCYKQYFFNLFDFEQGFTWLLSWLCRVLAVPLEEVLLRRLYHYSVTGWVTNQKVALELFQSVRLHFLLTPLVLLRAYKCITMTHKTNIISWANHILQVLDLIQLREFINRLHTHLWPMTDKICRLMPTHHKNNLV